MNKTKLKQTLFSNKIGKVLVELKKNVENRVFYFKRKKYIPLLSKYIGIDTTIISSNCFAGRIMQDLHMQYNSPTLGLYIMYPDYIEFLQNLEFYLREAKLEFVEHSKYRLGDERRANWKHWYPIGLLGGKVEIHFLHYYTEEEAREKWYRRASRVNFNKLLVIGMEQNRCTLNDIRAFDNLKFKHKVMFTTKDIKNNSNVFVGEFESQGEVGDPYRNGDIFYRYLILKLEKYK